MYHAGQVVTVIARCSECAAIIIAMRIMTEQVYTAPNNIP